MAYSYNNDLRLNFAAELTYFVIHIHFSFRHGHSRQYPFKDTCLLQVFDQPLHGLLERVFLGSLYCRLALYTIM
jgi:hypothetical protein